MKRLAIILLCVPTLSFATSYDGLVSASESLLSSPSIISTCAGFRYQVKANLSNVKRLNDEGRYMESEHAADNGIRYMSDCLSVDSAYIKQALTRK